MKRYLSFFILLGVTLVGCASYEQYAAERTAKLRQGYPPGTSKEEVQNRWGRIKPDFSVSRPSGGWEKYSNQYIARKLKDRETSAGKTIETADRYWGPDGWMSLCYCWYYYNANGRIVDVEWVYKSD